MTNRFEELVTSPYDDEPGGNRPWPRWLLWIGVAVIAVVVVATFFGRVAAEEDPPEVGASSSMSSVPDATDRGVTGTETDIGDEEPDAVPLAKLAFDTSAFGSEQALGKIEKGTITDQWGTMAGTRLTLDEEFHVGSIPDERLDLVGAIGVNTDPYENSFGGPTTCLGLVGDQGASVDCFAHNGAESTRPVFTGLIGTGVVSWGLLPEAASIGVLTVNGRAIHWQRPTRGIVAFRHDVFPGETVELVVLDDKGTEIDRGTRHTPPVSTKIYVQPITGYGDYSDVAFEDMEFAEVDKLIVGCMNANDIPAFVGKQIGPFHAIDLEFIAEEDLPEARDILARCRMGLNLPDRPEPTEAQWQERYVKNTELHGCLVDLGYEIEAGSPFEEWVLEPSETRWDPFLLMHIIFPNKATEALNACDN